MNLNRLVLLLTWVFIPPLLLISETILVMCYGATHLCCDHAHLLSTLFRIKANFHLSLVTLTHQRFSHQAEVSASHYHKRFTWMLFSCDRDQSNSYDWLSNFKCAASCADMLTRPHCDLLSAWWWLWRQHPAANICCGFMSAPCRPLIQSFPNSVPWGKSRCALGFCDNHSLLFQ